MEPWKEASIDARVNSLLRDVSFLTGRISTLQDVLAAVIKTHPDPNAIGVVLGSLSPSPLPNQVAVEGQRKAWQELQTAFPSTKKAP